LKLSISIVSLLHITYPVYITFIWSTLKKCIENKQRKILHLLFIFSSFPIAIKWIFRLWDERKIKQKKKSFFMWKCRERKIFRNINSMMHKDFLDLHQLTQIVEQQQIKKFFISITWLSNSLLHFYVNMWKIHQHFQSIVCLSCGGWKTNFSADSKCIYWLL